MTENEREYETTRRMKWICADAKSIQDMIQDSIARMPMVIISQIASKKAKPATSSSLAGPTGFRGLILLNAFNLKIRWTL